MILEMNLSSSFLLSLYVSQSLMCKVYNSTSLFFSILNINTKKPLLSPKWNSYFKMMFEIDEMKIDLLINKQQIRRDEILDL